MSGLDALAHRLNQLVARPRVQSRIARVPLLRRLARAEGEALFDLLAGFCHSQVLTAFVALDLHEHLLEGPVAPEDLAERCRLPPERLRLLLRAAAALGLVRLRPASVRLTQRGAALAGVPGLTVMILHNQILYRDMADPLAFLRGEAETEMARFWPYVFGEGAAADPEAAARYSDLMASSQALVAEVTLDAVSFRGVNRLLDVGGGSGSFLIEVARRYPEIGLTLFDLPAVVPVARSRLRAAALADRVALVPGSFREDALPPGADAISLIRVLFDHDDDSVRALLKAVHEALPPGGRLVISEPMGEEETPSRPADAYYALYTLAMGTGRTRTVERIAALCREAGFTDVAVPRVDRPFITRVVTGRRAGGLSV